MMVVSAVNLLTPTSMSHQKIAGVIKEADTRVNNYQQQEVNDTGEKKLNGLGSCESNHRRYTYRLKRQVRSWSKAGLKAMLRIIDAQ